MPTGDPTQAVAYAANLHINFTTGLPSTAKGRFGISGLQWQAQSDQTGGTAQVFRPAVIKPFTIGSTDPETAEALRAWFSTPTGRPIEIELFGGGKEPAFAIELPWCVPFAIASSLTGAGAELRVACRPPDTFQESPASVTRFTMPQDPSFTDLATIDVNLLVTQPAILAAGTYPLAASSAAGGGQQIVVSGGTRGDDDGVAVENEPLHLRLTPAPRMSGSTPHLPALEELLNRTIGGPVQMFDLQLFGVAKPKPQMTAEFTFGVFSGGLLINPFLLRPGPSGELVLPIVMDVETIYLRRTR